MVNAYTDNACFFSGGTSLLLSWVPGPSASSALRFVPTGVDGDDGADFFDSSLSGTKTFGGVRTCCFSGVLDRLRLDETSFRSREARVDFDAVASA